MPNWKTLIGTQGQAYRFVALSLSSQNFKGYIDANDLAIPAVVAAEDKNPTLGALTGTPQTIVVGTDGIVRKVWFEAFTPDVKRDVEAFFGLPLPVVIKAPA
jgi:hypothetical protein